MKIAFNGIGCGWGNNGGTQSVFRMADALNELGVETEMWAHCPSRFTWFKPKTPVRVCSLDNAPAVDVLINSGCSTTKATYEYPRKKIGVQWLRAHETWAKSEDALFALYGLDMPLWGNSEWEVDLVHNAGIRNDAEVQYCGIPHQEFYPVDVEKDTTKLHIGGLWSEKPRKRACDIMEVSASFQKGFHWHLFGNERKMALPPRMSYLSQPTMEAKRALYSKCDIWFAPTESEGLHIPPMEAALCGVAIVANSVPAAGNMDYCISGLTGLQYTDLPNAIECINRLRDPEQRKDFNERSKSLIRSKIGDVDKNAERMIARLEKLI